MGKHLGDELSENNKQAGCMWGIVHVLDYHHWPSNVRKMIHPHKHEQGQSHNNQYESSPVAIVRGRDGYEKLPDERELDIPRHVAKTKRSRATKRRSLRARFKAMISEETSVEDKDSTKSSLQRTYSIHHLESVDGFFGKIRKGWNHPIIFLPRNSEDHSPSQSSDIAQMKAGSRGECNNSQSPKDRPDVFEIFKVDKELLLKHLQNSEEGIANFSRSAFGLNTKGKFSKSRSFPVADLAERIKLKPLKLESKHKEVWSFPKDNKNIVEKSTPSQSLDYREEGNAVDRIDDDGVRKHTHFRSSSLNESVDRYARLFENSSGKDVKFSSSKSLKLTSEYGYAPSYSKRIRSLSNADSYYSDVNFEVSGENPSGASLLVIAEDSSSCLQNSEEETVPPNANMEIKEDDASLRLHTSNYNFKNEESLEDEDDQLRVADCLDITLKGVQNQGYVSDSDIFLQDTESPVAELHVPNGKEQESKIHKLDCGKKSDLDYVRYLLEKSGIARDASEVTWHTSDQLLSPQLFEEVEGGWPHEEDELDGWPDFRGCWHHQMLFDVVNEALVDVYDVSLPYYPKALSSSCNVRPFPEGNCLIEEVCTSIGTLMNVKDEEKQMLDCIVGRDLARDRSWMNLQLESEAVALDLEDMIFNELVLEVMCC